MQTVSETVHVRSRLADLGPGLTEDALRTAISEGDAAWSGCTDNDPPCTPGILMWGRIVRVLREILNGHGWTRDDAFNFSTVVSPAGGVAIAVATGDERTGLDEIGVIPTTRYPKGRATRQAIARNVEQLQLFEEPRVPVQRTGTAAPTTWFLLVRRAGEAINVELSLPDAIATDGRIESWSTRLILAAVPVHSSAMPVTSAPEDAIEPEVTVRRRETGA